MDGAIQPTLPNKQTHVAPWRSGLRLESSHVGHPVHEHDDVLDAAEGLEAPRFLVVVSRDVHCLREDEVLRLQDFNETFGGHGGRGKNQNAVQ